jgi:cell division protein FtsI (penicillin-binding protein 3)/stage V sporulation protein D (sporulation-specific penicillin-binding protein)
MSQSAKVRAIVACFGLACCFTGFSARLIDLQVTKHDAYCELAAQEHVNKLPIFAKRGTIQDIHGEILADNEPLKTVVVDGTHVTDPGKLARALSDLLELNASDIEAKITAPRRHLVLKEVLSSLGVSRVKNLIQERKLKGVTLEEHPRAKDEEKTADGGQDLVIDQSRLEDPEGVASALASQLGTDTAALKKKITAFNPYVLLKKELPTSVTDAIIKRIEEQKLRGITFEQDSRRIYPNGTMLCHVLGFMSQDKGGVQGIELTFDQYLHGCDGFRYIEQDPRGKELVPYRGRERQAGDGYSVRLTVDMGLQNIVETELDSVYRQYRPEMATAIMMDPQTGRIMAMANRPNFDPNHLDETKPEQMKNCAVINMVEPGSIFKIVTASGALNDKLVTPDTIIPCEGGHFTYAGKVLHDHGHGDHPDLSWSDVLVKSSNIGAAKLAMKMGEQRFYEYIRSFGFGERTGINLPGEISGLAYPPFKWSKISITLIPMGQGVGVTPIQMVAAMSAVANGGKLMMPQIVDAVVDNTGKTIVSYPPVVVRQVVDPETTVKVRAALEGVVSKRGTAFLAAVPGFRAAGKTGTANKPNPHGGYYDDRYVTSFIGFLPADDPKLVCLIMLDNPKASGEQMYGGTLAGPAFSHIGEKAARYLNLQPEVEPVNPADTEMKITKSDH